MTSCADVRAELVAYDRGESDAAAVRAVEAHVRACTSCATELRDLRRVLALVREATALEPSPVAGRRLRDAVEAEIAAVAPGGTGGRVVSLEAFRERAREAWEFARWRYERSASVRRFALASIALHAAALLMAAWLIVGTPGSRRREAEITVGDGAPALPDLLDVVAERPSGVDVPRPRTEAGLAPEPAWPPPFHDATVDGVALPPPLPRGLRADDEAPRFPTVPSMVRLRVVFDEDAKGAAMRAAADDLAPSALAAVQRGLAWLADRQRADGTWGPGAEADVTARAGATAAAVLAFTSDGESARRGPRAERMRRAVARLEAFVEQGLALHPERDAERKPLYSHALVVRALAQHYAVDFRYLTPEERGIRKALLARAGRTLLDWQGRDGGFGYVPRAERSDSSCTLFAAAALADLRMVGVLDTAEALRRAGAYLNGSCAADGHLDYRIPGDRAGDPTLTAGLLALDRELGLEGDRRTAVDAVEGALVAPAAPDALLAWSGLEALRRQGRPVRAPIRALLAAQRRDGSWPSARDRHCREGGDDLTTAFGVLALTSAYLP